MPDIAIYSARLSGRLNPQQFRPLDSAAGAGKTKPVAGKAVPKSPPKKPVEKAPAPKLDDFKRLAEGLENFAKSIDRDLDFRVDKLSGRTVVTVLDGETKKVIRQIPSKEILQMARLVALRTAALIDRQA